MARVVDRDFYSIVHEGRELILPRVTSILRVIDKSGPLMGWAVNCERQAFEAALAEVLTDPAVDGHQDVYDRIMRLVRGKRAWVREQERAADIGIAAHKWIEWYVRQLLGERRDGAEPELSEPSMRAVSAFLDWSRAVAFTPLYAERVVYCAACGFAGTLDCVAAVSGLVMCVDWKTGKAVYPEAHLQNVAYRHCLKREKIDTDGGLIVRLPKTAADPLTEAVPVPVMDYRWFLGVKRAWMWTRMMSQLAYGPHMTTCDLVRSSAPKAADPA